MSNIFQLVIGGVSEIFMLFFVAVVFWAVSGAFYKPEYIKNKVNLTIYILIGLIICFSISYYFSSDSTPPCLDYEYDTMGSVCVEYDDNATPPSYLDKIKQSSKVSSIGFLTFLAFIYFKRKDEREVNEIEKDTKLTNTKLSPDVIEKLQTSAIKALKEVKDQESLKKKIILIDDDEFLLRMYKLKFEKTGRYDVTTIQILDTDFVTQIFNLTPDMIISDNVRPGPDGVEIMMALKGDPRTKDIPFVFLSNTITPRLIEESNRLGVVGIIHKGKTIPQEVLNEIDRLFSKFTM